MPNAGEAEAAAYIDALESGPIVYYMQWEDHPGCVKIGTTRDLTARIRSHESQHGPLHLVAAEPGYFRLEAIRHIQFADLRVSGEIFRWSDDLCAHVNGLRQHRLDCQELIGAESQSERSAASRVVRGPSETRQRRRFVAIAGGDASNPGLGRFEIDLAAVNSHLDDTDWAAWDANPAERAAWATARHARDKRNPEDLINNPGSDIEDSLAASAARVEGDTEEEDDYPAPVDF